MRHKTVHRLTSALCTLALLLSLLIPASAAGTFKFSDVKTGDWCYDAIVWAVEKGITDGTTPTTFSPNLTCNNAQILTFLWRAAGRPSTPISNPFRNISSGDYYYQPALWAYQNGLVSGSTFNAGTSCTRAMAVTYIWKAMGMPFSSAPASFTDVSRQDYDLLIPVSWAVESGVTLGMTPTTFSPNTTCTRAQIVTFLNRAYGGGTTSGIVPVPTTPQTPAPTPAPTPVPTPAPTPAPGTGSQAMDSECMELLELINARRTAAGLNPLTVSTSLVQAAKVRADDISKGYMEFRADGSSWDSVIPKLPSTVTDLHETITGGSGTAPGILAIMSANAEASAAMMQGSYTQVAIGHVYNANGYGGYGDYWSLLYIADSPSSSGSGTVTTPAPSDGDSLQAQRQGVLDLVNAARAQNGAGPLTLDDALCDAAQLRANEIVQSFSHTRPNGSTCFTALDEANISYRTAAENIAAGSSTPAGVMEQWMNSQGHRENILNPNLKSIGIGYVKVGSGYQHYWVQMFTG